jgi:endonuclease G
MRYILLSILLITSTAWAGINQSCPQFTPMGVPTYTAKPGDQEICHKNYAVIHRCDVKAPSAVFEHLTATAMSGPAKRKDDFRPDPLVTPNCSATLADYATVGKTHDRGHMSPAANNTQDADIMSESFFLSNMQPQLANNNRGAWRLLESAEREWAKAGGDYYIISGGIWDQGYTKTGNGLGIPTRLYKIIYDKNTKKARAFLMPNAPISPATDWPKYETTVAAVQQATGMVFKFAQ